MTAIRFERHVTYGSHIPPAPPDFGPAVLPAQHAHATDLSGRRINIYNTQATAGPT